MEIKTHSGTQGEFTWRHSFRCEGYGMQSVDFLQRVQHAEPHSSMQHSGFYNRIRGHDPISLSRVRVLKHIFLQRYTKRRVCKFESIHMTSRLLNTTASSALKRCLLRAGRAEQLAVQS